MAGGQWIQVLQFGRERRARRPPAVNRAVTGSGEEPSHAKKRSLRHAIMVLPTTHTHTHTHTLNPSRLPEYQLDVIGRPWFISGIRDM